MVMGNLRVKILVSGLSLLCWAAYQKFSAGGEWFWSGALALALCNAGICCVVGAKKPEKTNL
jgi:hypothetical protein